MIRAAASAALLGVALAAPGAPMKMRPADGLSQEQKADYEALHQRYVETFVVLGRAKGCNDPGADQKMTSLLRELEERHGNGNIIAAAFQGLSNAIDKPASCGEAVARARNLRLPDLPPSLVLREGEAVDRILQEAEASTGPYRFVTRSPGERAAAEYLVIHRERVVFRSTEAFGLDRLIYNPTPVVIVATKHPVRKCRDGTPLTTWHAVSLPASGASEASRLEGADCSYMREYTIDSRHNALCAINSSQFDRRRSKLYRFDDSGRVTANGEMPVGMCPR